MRKDIKFASYLKLMRLDNLTGTWFLLWPALWGIILASNHLVDLLWIPVFMIGAIIMRSAGCIINDIIDIKLDRQVERTKKRVLANNELNTSEAVLLCTALLFIGLIILLTMGHLSTILGIIAMFLIILYPFAKYYIKYPQFILGLVFNFGALISWSTIQDEVSLTPVLLYIGCFFWIVYYDTIYGHQDKNDDKRVGVNSVALTNFGSKKWLTRFYNLALICWVFAGIFAQVKFIYYISIGLVKYLLYKQLKNIDLDNSEDCMKGFQFNARVVGSILFIGCCLGKVHVFFV